MLLRKCKQCGLEAHTEKELKNFANDKYMLYGKQNLCHKCSMALARQRANKRYKDNKENPKTTVKDPTLLKKCRKCGLEARAESDLVNFVTNKRAPLGKMNLCRPCSDVMFKESYRVNGKKWNHKKWKEHIHSKFGITYVEFDEMMEAQDHKCKLCGCKKEDKRNMTHVQLSIDHNHETGEIRGLLCHTCNMAIGMLKDDPVLIKKVLEYIS